MTLATLSNLNDAYVLRSMLEANGIPAFIPDENTCQTDWGYINAIGGVRIQIPEEFAKDAVAILKDFREGAAHEIASLTEENPETLIAARPDVVPSPTIPRNGERRKDDGQTPLILVFLFVAVVSATAIYEYRASMGSEALAYANAAYDKGDFGLAIKEYTLALESDPKDARIYDMRGLAYDNTGKYDSAIADYSRAIALDPNDEYARVNRGKAYADKGDQQLSIDDSTQAILIDPKDTQAYFNRGDAYSDLGKYDLAITDFTKAIEIDARDSNAYINRGNAYDSTSDFTNAVADYTAAIQIDPKSAKAYFGRGNAYDDTGDFANAIADYTAAIQIDPKSANAYNGLAWDLATAPRSSLRDGKNAVEYASKACELSNWKDSFALDTLAAAYAEMGDFPNAVKWEQACLQVGNPDTKMIAQAKERLSLYEKHQPFHTGK